jgi:O-antigen ligase
MNFFKKNWLYLLVVALPFERIPSLEMSLPGHNITIRIAQIIALAALGFGLLRRDVLSKIKPLMKLRDPRFWLVLYLLVSLISILISINKARSEEAFLATLLTIGVAILISFSLKKFKFGLIYKVMAWTALVVSIFGLYQFVGDSFGLGQAWTGLKANYVKQVFGFPRIQSVGLEPLYFANYLVLPLVATAVLFITDAFRRKWLALLFIFLLTTTLMLTLSRGGIIAGAFAFISANALLWIKINFRMLGLALATIVLGVLASLASIYFVGSINGQGQGQKAVSQYTHQAETLKPGAYTADNDRTRTQKLAADAFRSRPILGYGLGSFGAYAKTADPIDYPQGSDDPIVNNEYFEIGAETGVLGLITLAGFLFTLAFQILRGFFFEKSGQKVWIAIFATVVASYLIQYLSFSTLYIMNIWVSIGILMGLVLPANKYE